MDTLTALSWLSIAIVPVALFVILALGKTYIQQARQIMAAMVGTVNAVLLLALTGRVLLG